MKGNVMSTNINVMVFREIRMEDSLTFSSAGKDS